MPRRPDLAAPVPLVPWDEFLASFRWRQGEHVSLIGPTGTGKSTLALELLEWRTQASPRWHSAILATKPADTTLAPLARRGWSRIDRWKDRPLDSRRVILWPPWRDLRDTARQREAIAEAMASMFSAGRWAIDVDELSYLSRELRLDNWLRSVWQQGRSLGLSMIGATQRPAWVPLDLYSQATHLFFWRTNDDQDLRRIAGIGGIASATIRSVVATLPTHEALYVNARSGALVRTTATRRLTK